MFQTEGITDPQGLQPADARGSQRVKRDGGEIARSCHLGMKTEEIRAVGFGGNCRFTKVGRRGPSSTDHRSPPGRMTAALKAARQATEGAVIAVHSAHRPPPFRGILRLLQRC
ncbi:hypothetical protein ACM25O_18690 [Sulfitobacter pontiacus]